MFLTAMSKNGNFTTEAEDKLIEDAFRDVLADSVRTEIQYGQVTIAIDGKT